MAPSAPTAHPCSLSLANLTQLIAFPCGRGFCHSQPRDWLVLFAGTVRAKARNRAETRRIAPPVKRGVRRNWNSGLGNTWDTKRFATESEMPQIPSNFIDERQL